jgi:hypothetical protein
MVLTLLERAMPSLGETVRVGAVLRARYGSVEAEKFALGVARVQQCDGDTEEARYWSRVAWAIRELEHQDARAGQFH